MRVFVLPALDVVTYLRASIFIRCLCDPYGVLSLFMLHSVAAFLLFLLKAEHYSGNRICLAWSVLRLVQLVL